MRQVTAPPSSVNESLPGHLNWLVDTKRRLKTADHRIVSVLEFRHQEDDEVLSEWARHFRNHYCSDADIDTLRRGTSYSRATFLTEIKFPDSSNKPGPSIRAGDFSEILVADYIEYLLEYWVPRNRYCDKKNRNESPKGSDILGFKIVRDGKESLGDVLAI
jgi:hypothetical protein